MTAPDDIAIGDTFARPDALSEGWEVTRRINRTLFTLDRGGVWRFATASMLLDPALWVRVRAV